MLKSLKMRLFPPSSRSFHKRMDRLEEMLNRIGEPCNCEMSLDKIQEIFVKNGGGGYL